MPDPRTFRTRFPVRLRTPAVLTAVAGLLWASAPAGAGAQGRQDTPPEPAPTRYTGEYGLWVTLGSDSVTVNWLTDGRSPGLLEVWTGEEEPRRILRTTTTRSRGHRVSLRRPDEPRLRLRYGEAGGGSHGGHPRGVAVFQTGIRLDEPEAPPSELEGVDSLYVVGDVHGEYDRLRRLLENAGLVDGEGRWSGGRSQLVFMGDLMDRGADVRRTLWFVYGLQRQAPRAGGRVHTLLGNHEIMVLTGDHRYVRPKERLLARLYGVEYAAMYDPERSVLGRWIASWPAALQVDRVLLAHGGVGPAYRDWGVEAMNDSTRSWIREPLFRYFADTTVHVEPMDSAAVARRIRFYFEGPSPLWFRGFARTDTLGRELERTLEAYDADLHVIAHTPVSRIRHAYGDSVILADLKEPASELLLLVRSEDGGYERWSVPVDGEPARVPTEGREQTPG